MAKTMQDMVNWYTSQGVSDPTAAAQADWNKNQQPLMDAVASGASGTSPSVYGVPNSIRATTVNGSSPQGYQDMAKAFSSGDYRSMYDMAQKQGYSPQTVANMFNLSTADVSKWVADSGLSPLQNDPWNQIQSLYNQGPGENDKNYSEAYRLASLNGFDAPWLEQKLGIEQGGIKAYTDNQVQNATGGGDSRNYYAPLNGAPSLPPVSGQAKAFQDAFLAGDYNQAFQIAQQQGYTPAQVQGLVEVDQGVVQNWLADNGLSLPSSLNPGAKYGVPTYANGGTVPPPVGGGGAGGGSGGGSGGGGQVVQPPTAPGAPGSGGSYNWQQIGGLPGAYAPSSKLTYDPYTGSVNWQDETVQGQLAGLLADGNPLLDRVRAQALEGANARGLLNSSMAQGAATGAVLDRALQIATPDASAYRNQSLQNQSDINTALRDVFGLESALSQQDRQALWQQSSMRLEGQIKADLSTLDSQLAAQLEGVKSFYDIQLENLKVGSDQSNGFAGQAATLYDSALRSISNVGGQNLTPEQYSRAVEDIIASLNQGLQFNAGIYGYQFNPVSLPSQTDPANTDDAGEDTTEPDQLFNTMPFEDPSPGG